jgi:hypothetical protein
VPNTVYVELGVTYKNQFNLLKPTGYCTYYQVYHSIILHGDYIAFIYFFWVSQQTVTFPLYGLGFKTEVESVYRAVRTESLYNTDSFRL